MDIFIQKLSGKSLEIEVEVDEFASIWGGMIFKICDILDLVPAKYYILEFWKFEADW